MTGPATPGGWGVGGIPWLPTFLCSKKKKWKQKKNERVSKQKLLKGCHQGQKCYCYSRSTVSTIQNLFLSGTMAPPL